MGGYFFFFFGRYPFLNKIIKRKKCDPETPVEFKIISLMHVKERESLRDIFEQLIHQLLIDVKNNTRIGFSKNCFTHE